MKSSRSSEFGSSFNRSVNSPGGSSVSGTVGRHGISNGLSSYNLKPETRTAGAAPQRISPNGASLGEQRGRSRETHETGPIDREHSDFHTSKALFEDPAERKGVFRDNMGMYTCSVPDDGGVRFSMKIGALIFAVLIFCAGMYRCERNQATTVSNDEDQPIRMEVAAPPLKLRRDLGVRR